MLEVLLIVLVSAVALRDEGGGASTYLPTTLLARLVPTGTLALLLTVLDREISHPLFFVILWSLLFLSKIFAIDPCSQIAMNGNMTNASQTGFYPSSWVLSKLYKTLPMTNTVDARIYGTIGTVVRTSLWVMPILFIAFYKNHLHEVWWYIFAPAMALGYLTGGYVPATDPRVPSERIAGGILGFGLAGASLGILKVLTLIG